MLCVKMFILVQIISWDFDRDDFVIKKMLYTVVILILHKKWSRKNISIPFNAPEIDYANRCKIGFGWGIFEIDQFCDEQKVLSACHQSLEKYENSKIITTCKTLYEFSKRKAAEGKFAFIVSCRNIRILGVKYNSESQL